MGFVNNHFIKFHSGVHASYVALISEKFWIKWTALTQATHALRAKLMMVVVVVWCQFELFA
jgi:hypothetical protein